MKVVFSILASLMLTFSAFSKDILLTEKNSIILRNSFNGSTTSALTRDAIDKHILLEKGKPLYLVLSSGGGSIFYGLELIEFLRGLGRPVETVTLYSASMAFETVQSLGKRYIVTNGILMAHKATGGFSGEFPNGNLIKRYGFWEDRIKRMDEITVARTNGKFTLESFRELYENEYWCEGQKCIDNGFADEIANVSCGKSLVGINTITKRFIKFNNLFELEYDETKCPLSSGLVGIRLYVVTGMGRTLIADSSSSIRALGLGTSKYKEASNHATKIIDGVVKKVPLGYFFF